MAFAFGDKLLDKDPNNTLVVDALNLAFRWKHRGSTDFKEEYLSTVRSLARSYDCAKVIITSDDRGSHYRREIFPEYKANRKEQRAEQTEEEKQQFQYFIEEFNNALDLLSEHYPVLKYKGVEADDLAAYIVKNRSDFGISKIWLISSDRDWDLLIRDGVNRFSYVSRKETTLDNWHEHYDVPPEMYSTYKSLTGDKGDNVPGIIGVGPKRATKIIEEFGDAIDIHAAIPIEGKLKYIQALNEFKDQILTNMELMDLITYCEDAIGPENIEDIRRRLAE